MHHLLVLTILSAKNSMKFMAKNLNCKSPTWFSKPLIKCRLLAYEPNLYSVYTNLLRPNRLPKPTRFKSTPSQPLHSHSIRAATRSRVIVARYQKQPATQIAQQKQHAQRTNLCARPRSRCLCGANYFARQRANFAGRAILYLAR